MKQYAYRSQRGYDPEGKSQIGIHFFLSLTWATPGDVFFHVDVSLLYSWITLHTHIVLSFPFFVFPLPPTPPGTDPSKSNQDKYGINLSFAGEKNDAMFAVYDGHGTKGSDVAVFAKKKLPQVLAKHIRLKRVQKFKSKLIEEGKSTKVGWAPHQWPFLEINELEDCCRTSFIETNEAMYQEPSVSSWGEKKKKIVHDTFSFKMSFFLM